jgi:hypothetical protein
MDSHLSLIGSVIIGGLFLLNLLGFQSDLRDHSFANTNDLMVQQNAMDMIELLEWDFQKIGFGVDSTVFALSDSIAIVYHTDLGADGVIDTVRYFISDTTAASSTPNPRDRILYKYINGKPQVGAALGVTSFKLKYFDINGFEANELKKITTIEVTLEVESTIPYNGEYSRFLWRKKITPPNVRRYSGNDDGEEEDDYDDDEEDDEE